MERDLHARDGFTSAPPQGKGARNGTISSGGSRALAERVVSETAGGPERPDRTGAAAVSRTAAHGLRLAALTSVLVACVFLPFFPGKHDHLATTLSGLVQVLGVAGLLLVPPGAAWLAHEVRRSRGAVTTDKGHAYALASLCLASLVMALVSLGAFVAIGPTLGLGTFALSAYVLARLARRLGGLKRPEARTFNPAPLYLVFVPIAVSCSRWLLHEPAAESSRNRAIRNSAALIAEIEAFREERGHYPLSLAALWQDYEPGVIGVERYEYAPRGDAYSVFFEQIAAPVGTREIVMYNKLDEHAFPGHDSDLLRWTDAQLAARPGHYALHDAASPHWKYFWFD